MAAGIPVQAKRPSGNLDDLLEELPERWIAPLIISFLAKVVTGAVLIIGLIGRNPIALKTWLIYYALSVIATWIMTVCGGQALMRWRYESRARTIDYRTFAIERCVMSVVWPVLLLSSAVCAAVLAAAPIGRRIRALFNEELSDE